MALQQPDWGTWTSLLLDKVKNGTAAVRGFPPVFWNVLQMEGGVTGGHLRAARTTKVSTFNSTHPEPATLLGNRYQASVWYCILY